MLPSKLISTLIILKNNKSSVSVQIHSALYKALELKWYARILILELVFIHYVPLFYQTLGGVPTSMG